MKYTNRLMASLVAAMFILSLFSGVAAAQTPEEQYRLYKEKYENTKKKFEEAKGLFESARERFRNAKDNQSREELKDRTKDYLIKAIDHLVSHLEILKYRVELNENKGIIPFDASGNIEAHVTQLEAARVKVGQAETARDFIAIYNELKDEWFKIRLETRYYIGIVVNYRIDQFIVKADNQSVRIDTLIQKLKDQGKDVTTLEEYALNFDTLISEAKTNHQNDLTLYGTHSGFDSNGLATDNQGALAFLQQATTSQKDTISKLKSASEQFREVFKEAKKIIPGKVVVRGTGKLEANGTGSARISGNVTVTVSGNATLIVSSNALVTTDGTGTKETLGNGDVKYQGFGSATITGEDIRIEIHGDNIVLTAEGSGSAVLAGKGTYYTEKEFTASGEWKKVD